MIPRARAPGRVPTPRLRSQLLTSRPLAELLAETHDAVVLRLHGRPRDPDSGRDKVTVVYVPVTASAGRVAGVLRDVADKLERGAR